MVRGRAAGQRLLVPMAFEVAARISARGRDAFLTDPTQLANGLLELHRALGVDGIVCALADGMELESARGGGPDPALIAADGSRVRASLEACARLRSTVGDGAVLAAGLTGPATLAREFGCALADAGALFTSLVTRYCEAGADMVVILEASPPDDAEAWADPVRTAANVVRFHRGLPLLWKCAGPVPEPHYVALDAPQPVAEGVVTTDRIVPADADIEALRQWVATVSG